MLAARKAKPKEQETVEHAELLFSKTSLVRSAKYRDRRDLVSALLDDNKKYTMGQVDRMIEDFMKGKVI